MEIANLLPDQKAAELLGIKKGTLSQWRSSDSHHIPYIKIGRRIFYLYEDLETWVLSQQPRCTIRSKRVTRKKMSNPPTNTEVADHKYTGIS